MITEMMFAIVLQTIIVTNPRTLIFNCPDHALDNGHEVDIISDSGVVTRTLDVGDPPADGAGDIRATVNVMPESFGLYTFKMRAKAGTVSSETSEASPVWRRAPGAPTNLRPGG